MVLRPATIDDSAALLALIESAYRGDSSRVGWTSEADLLDGQRIDAAMLASMLGDDNQRLLLIEDADGIAACVNVERREGRGYVGLVTVRPTGQGSGLGRQLLAAAEELIASEWQHPSAEMTVIRQRAELIAWYGRNGYLPTGETRPFPYGDTRFGEPRRDDLEFVVLAKALPQPAILSS